MNDCGHSWHTGPGCPIWTGPPSRERIYAIMRNTTKDQFDRMYMLVGTGSKVRLDNKTGVYLTDAYAQLNRSVDHTHFPPGNMEIK